MANSRKIRRHFCELPLHTPIELRFRFGPKRRIATLKFNGLEYSHTGQMTFKMEVNGDPVDYIVGGPPLKLGKEAVMFASMPLRFVPSSIFCDMMQPSVVFEMPYNLELNK